MTFIPSQHEPKKITKMNVAVFDEIYFRFVIFPIKYVTDQFLNTLKL